MLVLPACGGGGNRATSGATTTRPAEPGASSPTLEVNAGPAPWPAPDKAKARILAAGLPALPTEQLAYHIHPHLYVFVDGVPQPVPANLGIDGREGVISPLHTHDSSGQIHIEAAKPEEFTLGQLFVLWGVRLGGGCVGGYCAPEKPVRLYVNGQERPGDPATVALEDGQVLALVIGTPPERIPDRPPGGSPTAGQGG